MEPDPRFRGDVDERRVVRLVAVAAPDRTDSTKDSCAALASASVPVTVRETSLRGSSETRGISVSTRQTPSRTTFTHPDILPELGVGSMSDMAKR
jgi:hypothetical protein